MHRVGEHFFIEEEELGNAFAQFGYRLSPNFAHLCCRVFDSGCSVKSTIKLEHFIQCCVMLRSLTDAFRARDTSMRGSITVNYEDFMQMVLLNKP